MQKRAKSILDELSSIVKHQHASDIIGSRASHVMQSAINLIDCIEKEYGAEPAKELERRLVNSIRTRDLSKFSRALKRMEAKNKLK